VFGMRTGVTSAIKHQNKKLNDLVKIVKDPNFSHKYSSGEKSRTSGVNPMHCYGINSI
jgi:hypothetical protein